MPGDSELTYGQSTAWQPERPRLRVFPLALSWLAMGIALMVAAGLLPGVSIDNYWGALLVAAIVAALNAIIPPILAALRLPLTLVTGFLLVLLADAAILRWADDLTDGMLTVDSFGWALLAALVVAAVSVALAVVARLGRHALASHRADGSRAGRGSSPTPTSPGSSSSRSMGSHCPCCAGRCATATPRPWPAGWPTTRIV